ncbi:hypothetical protein I6J77_03340 [Rhodanobacter sp. FDAARGOS 1247]|uniref:hypothetical protein n=1 Tax=Rhodanobacter sp. FDAARGOS 1247 TaxID=2778082 RepID=UPI0019504878|nr:hypothetical protein [Rhodanobacter sp. FDAARGOS 1247]QRP64503.1 hypothetical protein I6J77_03340 [Rhodanobacter sp. FDAARGOS 1247]
MLKEIANRSCGYARRFLMGSRLAYLLAHIPNMLVGVAIVLGFAHLVSPEEYGVFSVGFAFINIAGAIFYGWLQMALVRLGGGAAGQLGPKAFTVFLALLAPVIPCLILGLTLDWLNVLDYGAAAALAASAYSGASAASQLARGLNSPKMYGLIGSLRFILILVCAYGLVHFNASANSLLIAIAIGSSASIAAGLFYMPKALRENSARSALAESKASISLPRLISYGLPASLSLIAMMLMLNGDRFILKMMFDAKVVALYSSQSGIARQMIYPFIGALSISVVPSGVKALNEHGLNAAMNFVVKESRAILFVVAPLVVVVMAFGANIARAILPVGYREGAEWIMPMSAFSALLMGCRLVRYDPAFHLQLRSREIGKCALASLVAWLVLLPLLTKLYGPIGAAIAGVIAGAVALMFAEWELGATASVKNMFPWKFMVGIVAAALILATVKQIYLQMEGVALITFLAILLFALIAFCYSLRKRLKKDVI